MKKTPLCVLVVLFFASPLFASGKYPLAAFNSWHVGKSARSGEAGPAAPPPKEFREPASGTEFIFVKGGCFQMGDAFGDGYDWERPAHEVCVNDFYMGKYPVTVGEFRKFTDETGYRTDAEKGGCKILNGGRFENDGSRNWRSPGFPQDDRYPAVCISWNDASAFAGWLSKKTGKRYRLASEAEWEYAARSGGEREKWAGTSSEERLPKFAWYNANSGYKPHAVGEKSPNALGLYDMSGNVWEWVQDWFGENYYKVSPAKNPGGPSGGKERVLRGGSWFNGPGAARVFERLKNTPDDRFTSYGFRCVRTGW